LLQELASSQEAAWKEACSALRRVPGAEVLDDRLWVHSRLGVLRELSHRRRVPKPLCGCPKLLEDLDVRVATPQAGTERGELRLVDAQRGTPACARSNHICK
jgi:hypothetical protein